MKSSYILRKSLLSFLFETWWQGKCCWLDQNYKQMVPFTIIVRWIFKLSGQKLYFILSSDRGDPNFLHGGSIGGGPGKFCIKCLPLFCDIPTMKMGPEDEYNCCKCLEALKFDWKKSASQSFDSFESKLMFTQVNPNYKCPFKKGIDKSLTL